MANYVEDKRQYYNMMLYLKSSSAAYGFLGVFNIWVVLLMQMTGYKYANIELQNNPEKYSLSPVVPENTGYFDKFHTWIPVAAAVLITFTCLFALVVNYCRPVAKQSKFDVFGHLVAAVILVVASCLLILYVTNIYVATCGENGYVTRKNNEIAARNSNKSSNDGVKWSEFNCPAAAFLIATSVPCQIHYDEKHRPGSVGLWALFFVMSVVIALTQGVQCIRIFLLVSDRNTNRKTSSLSTGEIRDDDGLSISSLSSCDFGM